MTRIIGSIDNAYIYNTAYHLVFSDNQLYVFMTMPGKETRHDMRVASMSNPTRMVPIVNNYSDYRTMKNEVMLLSSENMRRGKEIEEHLDEKLGEEPRSYETIEYATVTSAELSAGTVFSLPHVIIEYGKSKKKFRLNQRNYQGRGKLPDEVFAEYERVLKEALGDRLLVKK